MSVTVSHLAVGLSQLCLSVTVFELCHCVFELCHCVFKLYLSVTPCLNSLVCSPSTPIDTRVALYHLTVLFLFWFRVVTGRMGSIQLCDSEEANERRRLPQRLPVQRQTQGRVFPEPAQRTVQFTVLGLCYAPKVQEVLTGEKSCKGAVSQITADCLICVAETLFCKSSDVGESCKRVRFQSHLSGLFGLQYWDCSVPKVQEILMAEEGCKAVCSKTSQWTA